LINETLFIKIHTTTEQLNIGPYSLVPTASYFNLKARISPPVPHAYFDLLRISSPRVDQGYGAQRIIQLPHEIKVAED